MRKYHELAVRNTSPMVHLVAMSAVALAIIFVAPLRASATYSDDPTIDAAEALSAAFRAVANDAHPSVGRVVSYTTGKHGAARVTGSAFAIRSDGYFVTNNHVVASTTTTFVEMADGRRLPAEIIGTDPLTDLAVILVDSDTPFSPLNFAHNETLRVGDWVIAVGFPLGLSQTVTAGIVSATNRQLGIIGNAGRAGYEDFIQTDAAINKGNSGGPLLNLRGEVVGVNSAIVTQTGGSDGLGFAIPASLAEYITDSLMEHGRVQRGLLGVGIQDLTPTLARSYGLSAKQKGVLLKLVRVDSPAGQIGMQLEDIIVAIDGEPVDDAETLRNVVARKGPGRVVSVAVLRDGETLDFQTRLARMDPNQIIQNGGAKSEFGGRLGMQFELSSPANRVIVADLRPGGPADLAGLQPRDIIWQINGHDMGTLEYRGQERSAVWLADLTESAEAGTVLRFTIDRPPTRDAPGIERFYFALEVPE